MKTLIDIESIFILLLCTLNTIVQIKNEGEKINPKNIFAKPHRVNNFVGLSATSISEITKVPRTTVLRKIAYLEKIGIVKKDKYKRYITDDLNKTNEGDQDEDINPYIIWRNGHWLIAVAITPRKCANNTSL